MWSYPRRLAAVTVAACLILTGLAGCTVDSAESACEAPSSMTFVVQATDNAPKPEVPSAMMCQLRSTIEDGNPITVIVADGAPYTVLDQERIDGLSQLSSVNRKDAVTRAENYVMGQVDQAMPRTAGINTIAALHKADASASGDNPVAVYVGPALSDQAPYNLTVEGVSVSPANELIEQLPEKVTLSGAAINWNFYGLGLGVGDQQQLSELQLQHIRDFYSQYLTRDGGTVEFLPGDNAGSSPEVAAGSLLVTPVEPVDYQVEARLPDVPAVYGDDSKLSFEPDQAVFVNLSQAQKEAERYAELLAESPGKKLKITGTTASFGTDASLRALSLKRAEAFAELLVDAGASLDQVVTEGVGKDFPEFVQDTDIDGNMDEDAAKRNRAIRITWAS